MPVTLPLVYEPVVNLYDGEVRHPTQFLLVDFL
jgi:aspartate carbamoyltransferase catalytic subunit